LDQGGLNTAFEDMARYEGWKTFSWKFKGWFSISVDDIFNIPDKQVYVDEFLGYPAELN
jgi:hypothetical protein